VDDDGAPTRPGRARIAWTALMRFRQHHMTDSAASLTYYAMMSLFPGLLAAVSLLSIGGDANLASKAANYLADHGANPTTSVAVHDVLAKLTSTSAGKSSAALVAGLLLALNGASGAYGAAGRALNRVNSIDEERGFVRRKLTDLGATLVVLLLLIAVVVALFLGGGVTDDLFGNIGLGSTAASIWSIARWPVAIAGALLAYEIVYAYAPDLDDRELRLLSPGAITAVSIWILGSVGFGIFLQNFPSYGAAYGTFGAAIVLLLWLFITANAFLYGAELNTTLGHLEREHDGPPFPTPPPAVPPTVAAPAPAATSTARRDPGM
jgi:membrane protein